MSLNIFKILYIAYLWRTKRAKLVGGRIAAAADTKYATSTSLSVNANIISVIVVAMVISLSYNPLVIGIYLAINVNLGKLFNEMAHLTSVRCSKIVLYTE